MSFAATLAISAPTAASPSAWTEAEVACAKTVGVDLRADPEPGSSGYIKRLAWLADLAVYANVTEVRRSAQGESPTRVRIKVISAKKGRPPSGRLTVTLMSGSPTFAVGETVLLFLKKANNENVYSLVSDSKFLVDDQSVTLQGGGSDEYNVVRSDYEIRQVAEAQSAGCR